MKPKHFSLEIFSDPKHLSKVEDFVDMISVESELDSGKIPGVLLAVTEATTNALIHGNLRDVSKKVFICADISKESLIIKVKDQGRGFNPDTIPDPTKPENLLKDSGRGLYLMRYHANELKYNITPEGTETILVISLP